ncbi:MAG TPA: LemA family protein, partial [Methylomirabilota bacterium]|nr:LemA family protein [Methylomirabilota bacterium]
MLAVGALAVAAGLAGWIAYAYNRLVRARNLVREAWSGIDVQLRRRRDLVPSLVEVVQAYGRHERDTFAELAALRMGELPAGAGPRGQAETALSRAVRQLLAVAEAYPELRASEQFLGLQQRLAEIEDHVQLARRYYNGTVRELNVLVEAVPTNVV